MTCYDQYTAGKTICPTRQRFVLTVLQEPNENKVHKVIKTLR